MTKALDRARQSVRELGDVPKQLAALEGMNTPALAEKYRELYGEPTRSRNRAYLRKRLAFRIQELAEGGLSDRALARIAQLGDQIPERWRMRQRQAEEAAQATPSEPPREAPRAPAPLEPRDPRVPPVGTVLRRSLGDEVHEVTVCAEGFEYAGRRYKTLSAVAAQITGTRWNGFLFFGLTKRREPARGRGGA